MNCQFCDGSDWLETTDDGVTLSLCRNCGEVVCDLYLSAEAEQTAAADN